jgi:hypothetical protein
MNFLIFFNVIVNIGFIHNFIIVNDGDGCCSIAIGYGNYLGGLIMIIAYNYWYCNLELF